MDHTAAEHTPACDLDPSTDNLPSALAVVNTQSQFQVNYWYHEFERAGAYAGWYLGQWLPKGAA